MPEATKAVLDFLSRFFAALLAGAVLMTFAYHFAAWKVDQAAKSIQRGLDKINPKPGAKK